MTTERSLRPIIACSLLSLGFPSFGMLICHVGLNGYFPLSRENVLETTFRIHYFFFLSFSTYLKFKWCQFFFTWTVYLGEQARSTGEKKKISSKAGPKKNVWLNTSVAAPGLVVGWALVHPKRNWCSHGGSVTQPEKILEASPVTACLNKCTTLLASRPEQLWCIASLCVWERPVWEGGAGGTWAGGRLV